MTENAKVMNREAILMLHKQNSSITKVSTPDGIFNIRKWPGGFRDEYDYRCAVAEVPLDGNGEPFVITPDDGRKPWTYVDTRGLDDWMIVHSVCDNSGVWLFLDEHGKELNTIGKPDDPSPYDIVSLWTRETRLALREGIEEFNGLTLKEQANISKN